MDSALFFEPVLKEIRSLRSEVSSLRERIPENQSIKRYSPQDIADHTPLSVQTVWAMIKDGRIKAERLGRQYLITQEDFDKACRDAKSLKYQRAQ